MSKKKKHPEHVNNERWLVSYADFITLLFAFFVVMFATAPKDDKNTRKISAATQAAFANFSIFDKGGSKSVLGSKMFAKDTGLTLDSSDAIGSETLPARSTSQGEIDRPTNMSTAQENYKTMTGVRDQIDSEFYDDLVKQNASVSLESRGIVISFKEAVLFDEGSSKVNEVSEELLNRILKLIEGRKNFIQVEGYSDGSAADSGPSGSSLEISSKRATEVAELLVSKFKVPPEYVSTAGYGSHRPVADNATAEGRAKNRRVDVVLLNSIPEEAHMAVPKYEEGKTPLAGAGDLQE